MSSFRLSILGLVLAAGAALVVPYPGPPASGLDLRGADRSCVGFDPPAGGFISAGFDPGPNWSGHWGVDFSGGDGFIRAAAAGTVSFSGLAAANLAVTVDHGGGLKTSYSRLGSALAAPGQRVGRGEVIGLSGDEPGHGDVHFSVRIDGEYVDPEPLLGCAPRAPHAGLRLVEIW